MSELPKEPLSIPKRFKGISVRHDIKDDELRILIDKLREILR